ncbi:MAG: hypothetical protein JRI23_05160 [Deltaproteobacteria bacterium]|nr:hypothetical protein [Deltaproteobacteria bacterium]MBW2530940.1 hypothetical protein [Deltaproteobacteria bacterium]
MTKSLLSRSRNVLVALSLAASVLSTGCAVGAGQSGEEIADDESTLALDHARSGEGTTPSAQDLDGSDLSERDRVRAEMLEQALEDGEIDAFERQLLDAEWAADLGNVELEPEEPELPEMPEMPEGPVVR